MKEKLLAEKENLEKLLEIYSKEDPISDKDLDLESWGEDMISNIEGHDRIQAIKSQLHARLEEVNLALKKIEEGSFGICENCGRKIERERLEIIPTARYCLDCSQKRK